MGNTYNTGQSKYRFDSKPDREPEMTESTSQHFRYYPREVHQQRVANKFFRSNSMQLYFVSKDGSPAPKKARVTDQSFISLPSCPEFNVLDCNSFRAPMTMSDDQVLEEEEQTPRAEQMPDDESLYCATPVAGRDLTSSRTIGPITSAVLTHGLTARLRSWSSWLLNDHKREQSWPRFSSPFRSGRLSGSLNFSLPLTGTVRERKRKLDTSVSVSSDRTSTASLNSLNDGRTPWPIPWLEAIFLPEYPNKGPVNEKHFSIIGTIASGAFGKVNRVCLKAQPSAIFAMKVQNKSDVISKEATQQIKDEVSIHESLGPSGFVASMYASWQSRTKLYLVLQYIMGYGDLYQAWKDVGPFSEQVVKIYTAEIGLALDFIHSSGVIYRDLKMENVVLDENGHIQIVDFGLAKWLGIGDRTATICGTLNYMAPEIAHGFAYDRAVDWWSLGVLVHILVTGKYPYAAAKNHLGLKFEPYVAPPHLSPELQGLLSRLLMISPYERLQNLSDLRQEPFFERLDFNVVAERQIHPFDYIPRMKRCLSCNTLSPHPDDDDAIMNGFQEQYDVSFTTSCKIQVQVHGMI